MLQYFPFLSDLGGIFIFKEEQKKENAEGGKYVLALILLGFNKSSSRSLNRTEKPGKKP